jgi:general secretion pathway protein G
LFYLSFFQYYNRFFNLIIWWVNHVFEKNSLKRQAGFTLLELMVVIVILGVLASMVVPNLMGNKEKADIQKATSDIVALEGSLDMYKLDNHRYPTTEQGCRRW